MFFIVHGMDHTDEEAPQRRTAARDAHLKLAKELKEAGKLVMASAYINDSEQMIGSMLLFNVENRAEIDAYLEKEAYISGDVWQVVDVRPCKVPAFFLE